VFTAILRDMPLQAEAKSSYCRYRKAILTVDYQKTHRLLSCRLSLPILTYGRQTALSHKYGRDHINDAEHSEVCTYEKEMRKTVLQLNIEIVGEFILVLLHIAHELDRHENSDQCHRPDQDKQTHQKNIHIQPFCSQLKFHAYTAPRPSREYLRQTLSRRRIVPSFFDFVNIFSNISFRPALKRRLKCL
jgi:hypothetical protein